MRFSPAIRTVTLTANRTSTQRDANTYRLVAKALTIKPGKTNIKVTAIKEKN